MVSHMRPRIATDAEVVEGILAGQEQCWYCGQWRDPQFLSAIQWEALKGLFACNDYEDKFQGGCCEDWVAIYRARVGRCPWDDAIKF